MLVEPRRWGILALLFVSITINLLDRQVLSVLAPLIRDELKLTNTQYSYIIASFLLGLTLMQVPSGMLIDRKGPRIGLPLIMIGWSIANGLHSVARGVWHLCTFRFLLGAGECGNYSAGVKVISQWFPPQERAFAGGLFNSGTVIGAFAAPPLIVWIASNFGWRMAFVLPSALGLLWIAPWLAWYRDNQTSEGPAIHPPATLGPLLRKGEVWGAVLLRALAGPVVHFYWYWLPEYLKRERGFTMEMIGLWAGLPFLSAGLGNIAGGWFSGHLIKRGWTLNGARKTAFVLSGLLCLVSMVVPVVPSEFAALSLICLATFGLAGTAANHIGLLGDLFSPRVLARLTGITGMCEGAVNMVVQLATGMVVDRFSYLPVFIAAGVMPAIAVACLLILIPRVERVD